MFAFPVPVVADQLSSRLQGVSFHLISIDGKPAHDLTIQTESYLADGSATFTGTWTGDKGGKTHNITGSLTFDAQGNIAISFSWNNGQNSLQGTITRVYNSPTAHDYVYGYHYHLEGDVTTENQAMLARRLGRSHQPQTIPLEALSESP
ncbi:MAG TPA: hypothetical protein VG013_00395 [Gemmataceae bacterium]|nr:hypothetical protein [Gemmataceae bacterium]